ncbi:hypothetical protein [Pararobbsia alpina]|uniref:hypothetical protein n=1 Tax=Pararobbsia alpina TaxID=621374 RepID=UPI0039A66674
MNATLSNLGRGLLRMRLAIARMGIGASFAAVLLLGAAGLWVVVLPGVSTRVDDQAHAVALARKAPLPKPVVSAPALASQRLNAFYAGLGDGAHTEQIVGRLFDAASEAGVVLDRAEYKPAHDVPGRFDTYTVILPLKGDYSSLRRFSEKVLVTMPYAALDDMRFKRNSAGDPMVEANLRFTAFLRPVTWAPMAAAAPATAPATAAPAASDAASAASIASASSAALPTASSAVAAPVPAVSAPIRVVESGSSSVSVTGTITVISHGATDIPAMPTVPLPPSMALARDATREGRP